MAAGYRGTVHFSSSDPLASLPADYTFTATDAGVHTFSVSLMTSGPQSIAVTDVGSQITVTLLSGITVATPQGYELQTTGFTSPVTAGTPENFTRLGARLQRQSRDRLHRHGPVHQFRPASRLAGELYLHGRRRRGHTFTATLKTAGLQSITATDTASCLAAADSGIQVQPAAASALVVSGYPSPVTANTSQTFLVTAYDTYGNVATGYTGTVHFTSTDPLAALPANYTYTSTDAGSHFFSATFQTIDVQSSDTVYIAENNPSIYFLQGNVYNDLNGNNQFATNDPPIAGATVQLYKSDGTTLLGTTTTDANGQYLFDQANVAGGQLQAGIYDLVETPPAGYLPEGVQSQLGLRPVVGPDHAVDPGHAAQPFGAQPQSQLSGAGEYGTVEVNNSPIAAYIGLLNLKLYESGSLAAAVSADCVALPRGRELGQHLQRHGAAGGHRAGPQRRPDRLADRPFRQ